MKKDGTVHRIFCAVCVWCAILVLSACGKKQVQTESGGDAGQKIIFTDALGHEVQTGRPARTAVLSDSLAQAWLLAGGELCAVTDDAEEILSADPSIANMGSLKTPSAELLIAEEIDLAVLSAALSEQVKLYDTLTQAGITAVYFDIETFEDYKAMMEIFTDLTGHKELYEKNVSEPEAVIREQIQRADGSSPSVLLLRAYSTGVRAKGSDAMTGQMLSDLGCVNIADSDSGLLDNLSMEAILEADPDFIFVTTMGDPDKALAMMDEMFSSNPAWQELGAVQKGHYHVLEKELFHDKPNNRWGESYRILADILYGEE